ncbi:MAG: hypothetical protein NTZ37_01560, partial [Methanoregula sp.]|nr:hypothetical protein [Methanoregula sp.]
LDMAGFSSVFDMFPSSQDAVKDMVKKRRDPTLFNDIFYKKIFGEGVIMLTERPDSDSGAHYRARRN